MSLIVKSYSRRQLTREERIAKYRISRARRVVENALGILPLQGTTGTMQQRPRVIRDIVITCMVFHNMLRTHKGGADRAPTPGNDLVVQQNEQMVYVPNENYRNPSRDARNQQELLKDTSITWGHWLGRRTGSEMCQPTTLGTEAVIYQSFSGLTNYSKNFYLSWCCSIFKQISKRNPIHFQQVAKLFQTKSQVPCLKHSTQVMSK